MSNLITLYDIPGKAAKDFAWSPNTWKARLVLNIKGLPYKTAWVEYPDIAPVAKKIGASHTSVSASGPHYTAPFIEDPSHKAVVADSFKIAQYLDETYPDTPAVVPKGTAALQNTFSDMFFEKVGYPIYSYINYQTMKQLPQRSEVYWRKTREASFGVAIEEIAPEGSEKRAEIWKKVIAGLKTIDASLSVQEEEFIAGGKPTFADVTVVAVLTWPKRILGEGSPEWQEILQTDGGRWGRLMKAFEKWETVDEEGLKGIGA
ncbi:uncharacterized protein STEHIDRAFT_161804 [Stereum hirsutum FP-91666 SS1]|uniref:uncharacterized protein n=1 Tax=Stereum hirsutum (strain FP-91666) TaxID=721885 RepID=UPI000444946A|nr:uncharacterized protein STEHIDRAFT_161804 [Stereum hirsutum FP-91666 SS1]EIM81633.1 hypothetical protein STEHIDRAFT_161804 [Stereum hirsutum FP-91666 SS1]